MLYPVILAGGSGTRLWPLSRQLHPKQLLALTGGHTMLQETLGRLDGFPGLAPPIVVCNDQYRFMVAEQLWNMSIQSKGIILEPVGRNTAPAVAVAALMASSGSDGEDLMLVLPADHFIHDVAAFHIALATAASVARQGRLVTFGIVPDAPETGYGYIRKGEAFGGKAEVFGIDRFVEKPDLETAKSYVDSGEFLWNSGMFLFPARLILEELGRLAPDMLEACVTAFEKGTTDLDFFRLDAESFGACPGDSIDYAVMEKTALGAMVPLQAGWNDVGSWEALWQVGKKDPERNVVSGDVLLHDVKESYLRADSRLLAAVGLENHIVVETADAVLISPRDRVQDVKALVERLKAQRRVETERHKTSYKPWGSVELLVLSDRFRVNRVVMKPGASLGTQKHFNRAEHWIVVKGTARVMRGGETMILTEGSSTYIPPGEVHRLSNPGKIALEVIEVQTGGYLGDDDIERMEDGIPGWGGGASARRDR